MPNKNYYKIPQGVVQDPFTPIYDLAGLMADYESSGEEFVLVPEVETVINYAQLLEEMVPGDFNIVEIAQQFRSNIYQQFINGLLAYKVKVFRLYKDRFTSFQHYCEKALGMSHWQVNRLIEAARIWLELATSGRFTILPKNESQCRPLLKLTKEKLFETWDKLTATKEEHKITATSIKEELGIVDEDTAVRLNKGLLAKLKAKAAEQGKTLEEFLGSLVEEADIEENLEPPETESKGCRVANKKPPTNVAQNQDKNLANWQHNAYENPSQQNNSSRVNQSDPCSNSYQAEFEPTTS